MSIEVSKSVLQGCPDQQAAVRQVQNKHLYTDATIYKIIHIYHKTRNCKISQIHFNI